VKHHAEVSTVTRTVMLLAERPIQRLSRSLQLGIGFFRNLIPDLPWVFLTVDFPGSKTSQEKAGLTTFRVNHGIG
jgi:hypothetical protein